jgi:hypothetical protein
MINYNNTKKNIELGIYFENPNQMGVEVEELIDLLATHVTNTYCKHKDKNSKENKEFRNSILEYIATTANKLKK